MELLFWAAAAALCTAMIGLILKKTNPELAMTLSMVTVVVILAAAMSFARGITELAQTVREQFALTETLTLPVLKCLAIAVLTRLCAELCRDASQTAAAAAVELAGGFCAMTVVLPLVNSVLRLIGGLL